MIPYGTPASEVYKYIDQNLAAQKLQEDMQRIVNAIKGGARTGYVFAATNNHWILFAIVRLPNQLAKIYMIDSNNQGFDANRLKLLNFIMPYFNQINKGKKAAPVKQTNDPKKAAVLIKAVKKPAPKQQQTKKPAQKPKPVEKPAPKTQPINKSTAKSAPVVKVTSHKTAQVVITMKSINNLSPKAKQAFITLLKQKVKKSNPGIKDKDIRIQIN